MLGYTSADITDMTDALDSVLSIVNSDDDPWLYNNLWQAKNLLEGLIAQGHIQ
jgi:hypothetical protein